MGGQKQPSAPILKPDEPTKTAIGTNLSLPQPAEDLPASVSPRSALVIVENMFQVIV